MLRKRLIISFILVFVGLGSIFLLPKSFGLIPRAAGVMAGR